VLITKTIPATVHGRYLYDERAHDRVLVGFHGYAETADVHLEAMRKIPGIDDWSLVSIQALHPFYTRGGTEIVASWMTSLDRELAIDDNIAYVRSIIESLPPPKTLVFLGFSQGAAMAARAAVFSARASGLVLLGGDIPPDVRDAKLPPTLLGRGMRDEWYSEEKLKNDLSFLASNTRVETCVFEGGHEWTDEFRQAVGKFLRLLSAEA
jgi:predicted esterase